MNKIAVIGLGYVGLPLALLAEKKGFEVIGIDLDAKKIANLSKHQPIIDDKTANERLKKSKINFTSDFSLLSSVDIAVICVPTPVDKDKHPDLTPVKNAVHGASKHLKNGSLLIIESTINPGVCDELITPLIEKETSHIVGKTLHLAHCPERINPGDPKWSVDNINRVLGADSPASLELAFAFYSKLVDGKIKKMANIKEAEAVKIVENSFRDINIAFVNELAMSFNKLGININNVIDGAATKPFAFMPHYPGIGVGGHCIPVDPYYLIEYARNNGFDHKFLSLARSINESMPIYAIDLLKQEFKKLGLGTLKDKKIAVLGLSYKANVGDDRESPAYTVISELQKQGAKVSIFDPYMPDKSTDKTLKDALKAKDAVVLVTAHEEFLNIDPKDLAGTKIFLDGRNVLTDKKQTFADHRICYRAIGIV